jgi:hypothetical protein
MKEGLVARNLVSLSGRMLLGGRLSNDLCQSIAGGSPVPLLPLLDSAPDWLSSPIVPASTSADMADRLDQCGLAGRTIRGQGESEWPLGTSDGLHRTRM